LEESAQHAAQADGNLPNNSFSHPQAGKVRILWIFWQWHFDNGIGTFAVLFFDTSICCSFY
jgi:hypothetical protein